MPLNDSPAVLTAWLRLSLQCPPSAAIRLLRHIGLPGAIFRTNVQGLARYVPADLAAVLHAPPPLDVSARIVHTLKWTEHPEHYLLPFSYPDYPAHLLTIGDAPLLLYVAGNPAVLKRPGLAIVGARNASIQGRENARAFAYALASRGLCILSGMARGIDAGAHEGALTADADNGAGTIAVMGTGLDECYPRNHAGLAERIRQHGALVSELPLDFGPRAAHFPRRNRIVAGLARGVLVVEGAANSGSLITARLANDTGRDVFAIPGSIHAPLARGCHGLIRQGAKLVETAQDILEEYPDLLTGIDVTVDQKNAARSISKRAPHIERRARNHQPPDLLNQQSALFRQPSDHNDPPCAHLDQSSDLLTAMSYDAMSLDTLAMHTAQPLSALTGQLLTLTLARQIVRLPDGRYQRVQRE